MTEHDWDGSETMGDTPLDESKLGELARLANRMKDLEKQVEEQEGVLAVMKYETKRLSEIAIPGLMEEMTLAEIKLEDGTTLTIKNFYGGKIDDVNQEAAYKWLEDEESDDIIKGEIKSTFGKGEEERAAEQSLLVSLKEMGVSFTHKRGIHHSTLAAFIKERIESGKGIPLGLFGVYQGKKTKIGRK